MISNDKIRKMIKDAESKTGVNHAWIASKADVVECLKEVLTTRTLIESLIVICVEGVEFYTRTELAEKIIMEIKKKSANSHS